ncbi:transcription antitermination protein NusB [Patescibacteria group bacterium]|nr:transcription antitermination protein NusB [Patescibacteria group bacterium]
MTDTDELNQTTEDTEFEEIDQSVDPRHLRRIQVMQAVFAFSFYDTDAQKDAFLQAYSDLKDLITELPTIDQEIQGLANERPLSDINKVDLAILRSIVFEWKTKRTPKKVLIDEAVELAKEFGTESSPKFVNGVLAHLFK